MGERQQRVYPLAPTSATALTIGDLIPVQGATGTWACLQVLELAPRKRKTFIAGLLDWRGDQPPSPDDVTSAAPLRRALTGIEVFTEGGLTVTGNVPPVDAGQEQWFGPSYIGKRTTVWGWKAAIDQVKRHADRLDGA